MLSRVGAAYVVQPDGPNPSGVHEPIEAVRYRVGVRPGTALPEESQPPGA